MNLISIIEDNSTIISSLHLLIVLLIVLTSFPFRIDLNSLGTGRIFPQLFLYVNTEPSKQV